MSTITEKTSETPHSKAVLPNEKCDRCGALAHVLVYIGEYFLTFCGHHFDKHQEAIRKVSSEIYDDRS